MYSVILPTVNEAENIPYLFELILKAFEECNSKFEIIVVDDASTDGTPITVIQLQKIYPEFNITLIRREKKLGLGTAYIEGFKHAKGDFIIIMDSDLSHHPKYIPIMIKKQKETGSAIVFGTRYSLGGGVSGWPISRILISRIANLLIKLIFWTKLTDVTGSYRLYRRDAFEKLINIVECKGFGFQMEAALLSEKKFKLILEEIPITFTERIYGNTKLSSGEVFTFIKAVVKIFFIL